MAGNKKGGETLRQSQVKKYGSYEAWQEHMRLLGSKGGKNGRTGGFHWMKQNDPERLRDIGRKYGGRNRNN